MENPALQNNNVELISILYEVARKLEHATGVEEKELDEMKRTAFETFLKIEEVMGIKSTSKKNTRFPVNEMFYLANRIGTLRPEIEVGRRKIEPLLNTLIEISDSLPG